MRLSPDFDQQTIYPKVPGVRTYSVEIALAYRHSIEVAASSEDEAEEKAREYLDGLGAELVECAQVVLSVA